MSARPADAPERRQAVRFPIRVPVRTEKGVGLAREVSTASIFFEIDQPFEPGEDVSLSVVLEHAYPGLPIRLRGRGRVVRVEEQVGRVGVAVSVTWSTVEPEEPPPPDAPPGGDERPR